MLLDPICPNHAQMITYYRLTSQFVPCIHNCMQAGCKGRASVIFKIGIKYTDT